MAKEYRIIKCPFCKKGDINIIYFPSTVRFVKGPWGGGQAEGKMTNDNTIVETEKCPHCGKSDKEISKALKRTNTVQISHEEMIKRIRKSGLPTKLEF